ncbi:hypothetical protein amb3435 [Paramagnetospirillum magneticum AMB-1]|uniref:Uncharacterized protein n=1 Tax=Paramagnetospirillum magneticum (strain ATCC 700264 / AMB-1) TaxID=342108 RepID=Q2W1N6_PARM1|nr:hypothetical protein amb3435 [Paramagnetospirillum magneticum AMB-1]
MAMVSALAPGSWVVTWMVGKSTWGRAETGSSRKPRMPASTTAKASSQVATGRRMKGAETFMTGWPHRILSFRAQARNPRLEGRCRF